MFTLQILPAMRSSVLQNRVKQRAKKVLKQKRIYEGQLERLRNQSLNMQQASFATQQLKDTKSTVDTMKAGVKEMRKEYKKIDIGKIEVGVHVTDDVITERDHTRERVFDSELALVYTCILS